MTKRYYVVIRQNGIPLHAQPEDGYTRLQAICRVQREAEHDKKLFDMTWQEATSGYDIVDTNFKVDYDAREAF